MKRGPKHGNILGIKVDSTTHDRLLASVARDIHEGNKFYIVTPNPEIVLMASKDWLLKKSIARSDYSVPDGIGLSMAARFNELEDPLGSPFRLWFFLISGLKIGFSVFTNKKHLTDKLEIIKGREIFWEILDILNKKSSRVYLVGGSQEVAFKVKEILSSKYTNITFQTRKTPNYNYNGQPKTAIEKKEHKQLVGSIKLFEPDMIFVALGAPRQEKWIFRNFFRTNAKAAMAVGGTFDFIAGVQKLPPALMERWGLEWLWRLINDPKRIVRIFNASVLFPWEVFITRLFRIER